MRAATQLVTLLLLAVPLRAGDDLEALAQQLGSKDLDARDLAYQKLLRLRDPKVVPHIEKRIESYPLVNQMHGVLVIAGVPPRTSMPALRRLMRSETPGIRMTAATQLWMRGEKGALEVAIATLTAPAIDESTRGHLIQRARYLRNDSVYAALRGLIAKERSVMNLYGIFDALSQEQYSGAQAEARKLLASDERTGPRAVAAAYLVGCGAPDAPALLAAIIKKGPTDISSFTRVKNTLLRAQLYPDPVVRALAERVPVEPSPSIAALMIDIIGRSGHDEARGWIEGFLEHKEGAVAKAALHALTIMHAIPAKETLLKLLASEDDERALVAAGLLRRMDDAAGFDRVLRIAAANASVRRDAVRELGEFRRAEAVEPLLLYMADDDNIVRSYAATALFRTLSTLFPYRRFQLQLAPYDYRAPEAERNAAIVQIRKWWKDHALSSW